MLLSLSRYHCSHTLSALGDNGGGSGGGSGKKGYGGADDSSGGGGFNGNLGPLFFIVTTGLLIYAVRRHDSNKSKKRGAISEVEPADCTDETQTLKRLVREIFAELVKVRSRLTEVEMSTGVSIIKDTADATYLESANENFGAKTRSPAFSSAVDIGGGFLWADDARQAHDDTTLLQDAGVRIGTEMRFAFTKQVRDDVDLIAAECQSNQSSTNFKVDRLVYTARPHDQIKVVVAPLGGRAQDIAYTLNPIAGQGLTNVVRHGCPIHQQNLGSLVGIALDTEKAWGSFALSSNAVESSFAGLEPTTSTVGRSLFMQLTAAPTSNVSAGAAFLRQEDSNDDVISQKLGIIAAGRVRSSLAMHSWAIVDLVEDEFSIDQISSWGFSVASYPNGSANGWALGIGRLSGSDDGGDLRPNLYEASMHVKAGNGLTLSPGLLMLRSGMHERKSIYAGLRSTIVF